MRRLSSVSFRALIALLSVAMVTLGTITTHFFHEKSQEQYEKNVLQQEDRTNSMAALLDSFFYKYFSIANQIVTIPELRPVNLERENRIPPQMEARFLLQTLRGIDAQIIDLCMYYHGSDYFITSDAVYTASSFIDNYSAFNVADRRQLYDMFVDSQTLIKRKVPIPEFIPFHSMQNQSSGVLPDEALLLLVPVPYWSSAPYGILGILVQDADILHQLSLAASYGGARIVGADGETLFSIGQGNLPNGFADTEETLSFRAPSDRFPLTYETIVRKEDFARANSTPMNIVSTLIIAALAGLLCFVSAEWINQPIRNLVAHISSGDSRSRDETSIIRQHIFNLNQRVEESQKYQDELLIRRIVVGQQLEESAFRRCERMLMNDYSHCAVFLIQLDTPFERVLPLTLYHYDHAIIHVNQDTRMDRLQGIIACDNSDDSVHGHVEQLLREQPFRGTKAVAIGPIKEDMQQLYDSMIGASELLKEMQYQGRQGVMMSHGRNDYTHAYPVEDMHNIRHAMRTRDAELMLSSCADIVHTLQDEHTTLEVGTIVAYDLSTIFPELADLTTSAIPDFCKALDACAKKHAAAFGPSVQNHDFDSTEAWRADVEATIDELLETPGFGISVLSQKFGVSDSAFSHMFKRTFGVNFINYVNKTKIQRAKDYLVNSSEILEDVASRLGYSSSSNFSRMFKSYEGITPGAYRQVAQSNVKQ